MRSIVPRTRTGGASCDHAIDVTVKYKDGEKKIIVPPDVPIVTFVPGDKADLKPGIKIFIVCREKAAR
jgi:hypothetical protein